jgi:hypothetical protein
MDTTLGLLGLLGFIVCVILLAATITWLVVRLTPQRDQSGQRT